MAALSLPSWLKRGEAPASCQTALSRQPSLEAAIEEVAKALGNRGANDLALVFCSTSYASDLPACCRCCAAGSTRATGSAAPAAG